MNPVACLKCNIHNPSIQRGELNYFYNIYEHTTVYCPYQDKTCVSILQYDEFKHPIKEVITPQSFPASTPELQVIQFIYNWVESAANEPRKSPRIRFSINVNYVLRRKKFSKVVVFIVQIFSNDSIVLRCNRDMAGQGVLSEISTNSKPENIDYRVWLADTISSMLDLTEKLIFDYCDEFQCEISKKLITVISK